MSESINPSELGHWRLDELMPDESTASLDQGLKNLESMVAGIEAMRPLLGNDISPDALIDLLGKIEAFAEAASRLGAFAMLRFSQDTQDRAALAYMGRVEQAMADLNNRVIFFALWWRALPVETTQPLIAKAGRFSYYLEKQLFMKPFTLSEPEEKIVNIKNTNGPDALSTIYDIITNKFEFSLKVDGKELKLTRDALGGYVRHKSPEIRESAYREQFRLYAQESTVLGQIYVNLVRDWASENVQVRGFSSPISVRNLSNHIPDGAVDTLLNVCAGNSGVFQKYFKKKAGWLGLEKLRRFDLYAPIDAPDIKYPYSEAVDTVLDSFGRFSDRMRDMAHRVMREGHVDSAPRKGKRGGAFCYSVTPALTPWVLLNYEGQPRHVATLAHELGHAVHSMMASGHSVLSFHAPLPLAETASVFSEMLLTDHLLERETSADLKKSLIIETVDNIYASVMRQAFFVLFEKKAHEMVSAGASIEDLDTLYSRNLEEQFGDSVEVDEVFRHEWISIPHIYHTPFYCYAYSFGTLLSLAMYSRFLTEGTAFAEKFERILGHGGAMAPADILLEAGVDIQSASFWRGGFDVVEQMIARLD